MCYYKAIDVIIAQSQFLEVKFCITAVLGILGPIALHVTVKTDPGRNMLHKKTLLVGKNHKINSKLPKKIHIFSKPKT